MHDQAHEQIFRSVALHVRGRLRSSHGTAQRRTIFDLKMDVDEPIPAAERFNRGISTSDLRHCARMVESVRELASLVSQPSRAWQVTIERDGVGFSILSGYLGDLDFRVLSCYRFRSACRRGLLGNFVRKKSGIGRKRPSRGITRLATARGSSRSMCCSA